MSDDKSEELRWVFSDLRGPEYVTAVRALAIMQEVRRLRCGVCEADEASWVGMQRCGAPGGPICADCLLAHAAFMFALAGSNQRLWCRHCEEDVDSTHVYAVHIWSGEECIPAQI